MLRIHMELVITTGVTGMTLSGPMNHKIKILRIIHGLASTVDSDFLSVRHISVTKNWLLLKYISENIVRFPQPKLYVQWRMTELSIYQSMIFRLHLVPQPVAHCLASIVRVGEIPQAIHTLLERKLGLRAGCK